MTKAKLFITGGSQAVRLPKAFRFSGREVHIARRGRQVVLEPVETSAQDVVDALRRFTPDFGKGGRRQPPMQRRGELR